MAPTPKKRKLVTTKPPQQSPAAAAAAAATEKKKKPSPVIEPPKPRPEPVQEEEYEEEEVEYEEVEEEEEVDGDDEDGEGDGEESKGGDKEDDDDGEPIQKLLEPFSKEQLIGILTQAAEAHRDVGVKIRKIADEDPVHRKIFVHGLGWDTTVETLRGAFTQYGEIEDCKAVTDKVSGKSKGYGFILFKSRSGANKALKEPQKKIGNRMTACQLAAVGPVAGNPGAGAAAQVAAQQPQQLQSEYTQRKIFVSNVAADVDPAKLTGFFAKFGEIEEGPLGLDKVTGKPKGFCLFVYKTVESARRALEEPHKNFEGHMLHVQRAIDGPKPGKQQQIQQRNTQFGRNDSINLGGSPAVAGAPHLLAQQSVGAVPFNQGAAVAAQAAFNPALGHALTALLATQGAGLGLGNLLGTLGTAGVGPVNPAVSGGYGNPVVGGTGLLGGYNGQAFQTAYLNQQSGQGSGARSQHGHMGGGAPYSGH
ncbi:hypothetical protein Drorol1_Dr00012899 [Drosera rotundifolia]